ncbi:MAG: 4-hydroxyphenylpyruvate dioxygenase [Hyphomicrobiales bacterium]|nr:4-hydroxyphenylpyruvate dioxygenase [Hyphomicrobiales bacterium]
MGFVHGHADTGHQDLWDNPEGTDGFEFIEYATHEPDKLAALFADMGFAAVARHRSKNVTLYRQGDVNFILNAEPDSFAEHFTAAHGPCINAFAIRVKDAAATYRRCVEKGAEGVAGQAGPMELNIPAIKGIGGSLLYLVDRYGEQSIYDVDFVPVEEAEERPAGAGLLYIDHLTHNVEHGHMAQWAGFYERLFNFREIRYFDIEGKVTGLRSQAMTSPCGRIRIPINEEADAKQPGQIQEYLDQYRGEGVQHVALATGNIVESIRAISARGVRFLDIPETYYELMDTRLPGHGLDLDPLKELSILVDGAPTEGGGLLLQIFTENVIGPIFFEIIERRDNEGFGEGNFKALFESIELDQIRRGVVKE